MEFGIFLQGYLPGAASRDPAREHEMFMREVELVRCADRHNWKYVWMSEHHSLVEYSHTSSSEVMLGYLAAETERIHLGSGIFNLSPRANHPVRNAERAAMLDQFSKGRFEMGTGRGAGSHETATFNIMDTSSTKAEWDEVIWEIPRMWEVSDYTFDGEFFTVPTPHNVLPKPYLQGHPPIWVACGNPGTFAKAGQHGIGALGFNFSPITDMKPMIDAYKAGIAECENPVGQFVNDNVMITNAVVCVEDPKRARAIALNPNSGYLYSLVCLYHDTFPKPDWAPVWPERPAPPTPESIEMAIDLGALLCGSPDEVCEQLKAYEATGVDQVAFGFPNYLAHDEALECLEVFGQRVIPEFDTDPEHSTTRYRRTAVPKFAGVTAGS